MDFNTPLPPPKKTAIPSEFLIYHSCDYDDCSIVSYKAEYGGRNVMTFQETTSILP
jgi:hypothetical protein